MGMGDGEGRGDPRGLGSWASLWALRVDRCGHMTSWCCVEGL